MLAVLERAWAGIYRAPEKHGQRGRGAGEPDIGSRFLTKPGGGSRVIQGFCNVTLNRRRLGPQPAPAALSFWKGGMGFQGLNPGPSVPEKRASGGGRTLSDSRERAPALRAWKVDRGGHPRVAPLG